MEYLCLTLKEVVEINPQKRVRQEPGYLQVARLRRPNPRRMAQMGVMGSEIHPSSCILLANNLAGYT